MSGGRIPARPKRCGTTTCVKGATPMLASMHRHYFLHDLSPDVLARLTSSGDAEPADSLSKPPLR